MKPDKRRSLIMEAAATSFAERGFHATTMNDVAEKSEISVGALYRYFVSKDALITAIIDQSYQLTFSSFAEGTKEKTLSSQLARIFADLVDNPPTRQDSALIAEVFAESYRNANVDIALSENELTVNIWLTRHLNDAKKAGQIETSYDPSSISLVLTALYDGLLLRASPVSVSQKEEVSEIINQMISTVLPAC